MSRINEYLRITRDDDGRWIECRCGERLCNADDNLKDHVKAKEFPIQHAGPQIALGDTEMSKQFVWREFYCPSCALLLTTEVALKDEPYVHDARLY